MAELDITFNIGDIEMKPTHIDPSYLISKCGKVYSQKTKRFMKCHNGKGGYIVITFRTPNGKRISSIHRLIAKAFIQNPEHKNEVNHINGIKTDNRIDNLEWVTAKENMAHASRLGLMKSSEKQKEATRNAVKSRTSIKVINIDTNQIFNSISEAARSINISNTGLLYQLRGKYKNKTRFRYYGRRSI